jgi:hypothetical protein
MHQISQVDLTESIAARTMDYPLNDATKCKTVVRQAGIQIGL